MFPTPQKQKRVLKLSLEQERHVKVSLSLQEDRGGNQTHSRAPSKNTLRPGGEGQALRNTWPRERDQEPFQLFTSPAQASHIPKIPTTLECDSRSTVGKLSNRGKWEPHHESEDGQVTLNGGSRKVDF